MFAASCFRGLGEVCTVECPPHQRQGNWLLGAFGECQVVGQPMATRGFVPPLIDQDVRDSSL
jgi:hypothetical protein